MKKILYFLMKQVIEKKLNKYQIIEEKKLLFIRKI